jgi:predicted metal-dependent phosphoesterase TrpH
MRYDLHAHSTASDGVLSPTELVRFAATAGLTGIALTDHDTVAGVAEALAEAGQLGIELIPGIELSIQARDQDVHVLGFWIDHEDPELVAILGDIFTMRERRVEGMVELLAKLGHTIPLADVRAEAGTGSPGRPHVARVLVKHGIVESVEEAFNRFLADGGPAFVAKSEMGPQRGFELLRRFGALSVMAHPGLVDYEALLPGFLALGLGGLEVDHPKHSEPLRAKLRVLCERHALIETAGTDFHMPGPTGRGLGSRCVDGETIAAMRSRLPV